MTRRQRSPRRPAAPAGSKADEPTTEQADPEGSMPEATPEPTPEATPEPPPPDRPTIAVRPSVRKVSLRQAAQPGGRKAATAVEPALTARIPLRQVLLPRPEIRLRLGPADRPVVGIGSTVEAGQILAQREREVSLAEARLPAAAAPPEPGRAFDRRVPLAGEGRHALRFDAPGRVLYTTPGGVVRAAQGRGPTAAPTSPVAGTVVALEAGWLVLRAAGVGLIGLVAAGRPTSGLLTLAVAAPDEELAPARIDVGRGGRILVAGARLDVEALGRARAIGVRGVISGGAVSRDLRTFDASERRQRAAAEAGPAFAMLVLDGYGKRPIPADAWTILQAAEGLEVAIVVDPPMLVLPPEAILPRPAGTDSPNYVRVTAGPYQGREGILVAPAGRRLVGGGLEAVAAWVRLEPFPGHGLAGGRRFDGPAGGPAGTVALALADLERSA